MTPALRPNSLMTITPKASPDDGLKNTLSKANIVMSVLVFGLGGAMALIPISSAVVASGEVTVASHVKKIAHPKGGVVAEIKVANGDHVNAGQDLIRFDTTVSAATASMANDSVDQLLARQARLQAERDAIGGVSFPPELTSRSDDAAVATAMRQELRNFQLARSARGSQRAALSQQIRQAQVAIGGYGAQAEAFRKQSTFIAGELEANNTLWEKGLTTLQRRNELNRSAVALDGSAASAQTSGAEMQARIAELRQQMVVIDENARNKAGAELSEIEARLTELRQNQVVAQDSNTRNLVRAPYDGVIDKLIVSTIGGVVQAGDTILEIVPDKDPLIVSARVSPNDIDGLKPGMNVTLRFSAFNMQTTPQISGRLTRVSADRTTDTQRGISYFPVDIEISPDQLARLGTLKLRQGMPVEVFIRSGDHTLLGYLIKPLRDQMTRAFREK
jgi:HlyD family secretion protein